MTKVIERVERMYEENDDLPILLVCHSMGAKMGHYFLNFAKKHKGQEWIDKYIHTYMPVGAPHGGVGCAVRTGVTGKGLDDTVDALVGNVSDGLQMYRTWSCGNWLMPRILPKGVFPTCIVRREGELGVALDSEIEVGPLFDEREKPPKELRLTVVFRDKTYAHTDYHPVIHNKDRENPRSMTVSFSETFYIAVPYLGRPHLGFNRKADLGELEIYLEEPAGRVYLHRSKAGKMFQKATSCIRGFKKKITAWARSVAKYFSATLRVAECDKPLKLRISDFKKDGSSGRSILDKSIPMIGCVDGQETIGSISLKLSYSPPPKSTGTAVSTTPIAMINENTPNPPIMSYRDDSSANYFDKIPYDVMNGIDVFKADGFVDNMVDLVKEVYEGDPLGPTKESSLDAPPVNCVRSIYGINVTTEAGAIYRKVPVVTIGDNQADCRYMLDATARFRISNALVSDQFAGAATKLNLLTYKIKNGIVYETPMTLQSVPGETKKRRCCGDGTVPYWNMVHALSWKDKVETLTVDELPGAAHRAIVADERFFALLKRYCKVIDPRANAMMMMKAHLTNATARGIKTLGLSSDDFADDFGDGKPLASSTGEIEDC